MVQKLQCTECISFSDCIFQPLQRQELLDLFFAQKPLNFKRNTVIYCEGLRAEGVYVLCCGSVKLTSVTETGAQRIAGLVSPGDLFGLDSLLPNGIRLFTATTREPCVTFCIDRNRFRRIVRSKTALLWRFTVALNKALHESTRVGLAISGDRTRTRLYNALMCLSQPQATLSTKQECRGLAIKQTELSELVGVSAETVSRELKKLRASGLIAVRKGVIIVRPDRNVA